MVVSNICYFHPPILREDSHFDEHIFLDGLVQPPTSYWLYFVDYLYAAKHTQKMPWIHQQLSKRLGFRGI